MKKSRRLPNGEEQAILDGVQVCLVERSEVERFNRLLDEHHYLGSLHAVGERLQYVALSREGKWLAPDRAFAPEGLGWQRLQYVAQPGNQSSLGQRLREFRDKADCLCVKPILYRILFFRGSKKSFSPEH